MTITTQTEPCNFTNFMTGVSQLEPAMHFQTVGMGLHALVRLHTHSRPAAGRQKQPRHGTSRVSWGGGARAPVGFSSTRREALVKVSWVTGSIAKPLWPSGTRVSRTGVRSFSRSFFPDAGQKVSMSGRPSSAFASGVLLGSQNARISCAPEQAPRAWSAHARQQGGTRCTS